MYRFGSELLDRADVSDEAWETVVARWGKTGAVDLIGAVGSYTMVSMILNINISLAAGSEPYGALESRETDPRPTRPAGCGRGRGSYSVTTIGSTSPMGRPAAQPRGPKGRTGRRWRKEAARGSTPPWDAVVGPADPGERRAADGAEENCKKLEHGRGRATGHGG